MVEFVHHHVPADPSIAELNEIAVEAGLKLLIQVKAQTGVRNLRGKVKWEGRLDEMRASRIQER